MEVIMEDKNKRPDGPHGGQGEPEEEFDLEKMEKETQEMLKLRYITGENSEFKRTEGGFVSLKIENESYPRVQVYRVFPFTNPDYYISIREPDEKAREIGVIRDLKKDVSGETRKILEEQMQLRYFTPIIEKVINIKDEYGFAYFDVLTDHGACRFTIHMGGSSVVYLSDTRVLITDLDGNRFEIPDIRKLTAPELKKLDLFL
jgi:hypothetical protein